jgi:hypothetical protein
MANEDGRDSASGEWTLLDDMGIQSQASLFWRLEFQLTENGAAP